MNKKIGISFVALAVLIGAVLVFSLLQGFRDESSLLCQGRDPRSGLYKMVRVGTLTESTSRITLFSKKRPEDPWKVELLDTKGIVARHNETELPERVSLEIDFQTKLQIYRSCAPVPQCRFEMIRLPSAETMRKEKIKENQALREAFEARKQTAMVAFEYSKLRANALAARRVLTATLKKEPLSESPDITRVRLADQVASKKANEMADRLHSRTMNTSGLVKKAAHLREISSQKIDPELTELEPFEPNKWCLR